MLDNGEVLDLSTPLSNEQTTRLATHIERRNLADSGAAALLGLPRGAVAPEAARARFKKARSHRARALRPPARHRAA